MESFLPTWFHPETIPGACVMCANPGTERLIKGDRSVGQPDYPVTLCEPCTSQDDDVIWDDDPGPPTFDGLQWDESEW